MYQKIMTGKRKIAIGLLAAMMVFLFAACGPEPLSEVFDEAKVLEQADKVLNALNAQDYKAIAEMVREEYKGDINEEMLKESLKEAMDEVGGFDSYIDQSVVGMSSKDFDGEIAVAIINAQYEYGTKTVTISYDTNYEIIGFYVK